jgi:hypothetical protein
MDLSFFSLSPRCCGYGEIVMCCQWICDVHDELTELITWRWSVGDLMVYDILTFAYLLLHPLIVRRV